MESQDYWMSKTCELEAEVDTLRRQLDESEKARAILLENIVRIGRIVEILKIGNPQ
jgi:hypothetical protein